MALRFIALVGWLAIALTIVDTTRSVAKDPADTSKIPRPKGAFVVYESPQTTILSVPIGVDAAAEEVERLLLSAAWQGYADPGGRTTVDPQARHVVVRKGATGLRVRIAPAPAQGNATTINYVTAPLRHDIPFPADASDIRFDPNVPHLEAVTGKSFSDISDFYVSEMRTRGWTLHEPPDGSAAFAGDGVSQRAFLTKVGQRLLLLFMRKQEAGGVAVKIETVSPRLLPGAEAKRPPPPTPKAAAREETDIEKQVESLVGDVLRDVQKQLESIGAPPSIDRTARAGEMPTLPQHAIAPSPRERSGAPQLQPSTRSQANKNPPIPLPNKVTNPKFDGSRGTFEFQSQSTVQALADFYRFELTNAGWTLTPKGVNRSTMIGLVFEREDKAISVTVARIGNVTHVMAQGDGLMSTSAADSSAAIEAQADKAERQKADLPLEAMESNGLPVPKPNSSVGQVTSLFRYEATAVVAAPAAAVLTFYRKELAARGWTEVGPAKISGGTTMAEFKAPDGPAHLTLLSKGDDTYVTLAVRELPPVPWTLS